MLVHVIRDEREIVLPGCLLFRAVHVECVFDVIQKLHQIRPAAAGPEAVTLFGKLFLGGHVEFFQTLKAVECKFVDAFCKSSLREIPDKHIVLVK